MALGPSKLVGREVDCRSVDSDSEVISLVPEGEVKVVDSSCDDEEVDGLEFVKETFFNEVTLVKLETAFHEEEETLSMSRLKI